MRAAREVGKRTGMSGIVAGVFGGFASGVDALSCGCERWTKAPSCIPGWKIALCSALIPLRISADGHATSQHRRAKNHVNDSCARAPCSSSSAAAS